MSRYALLAAGAGVFLVTVTVWIVVIATGAQSGRDQPLVVGTPAAPVTVAPPAPAPEKTAATVTTAVDPTWLTATATATGIPRRALLAYTTATLAADAEHPSCRLGWNTLAGIGAVESDHGRLGGGEIDASGEATPAILGPVLDGTRFVAVRDTDGGRFDGDTVWDHAVGPLQILPSTWETYGRDADGDGTADPQDIDDAALAAADYLCVAGGDLSSATGWSNAIHAYNHSDSYVERVRADAQSYSAG